MGATSPLSVADGGEVMVDPRGNSPGDNLGSRSARRSAAIDCKSTIIELGSDGGDNDNVWRIEVGERTGKEIEERGEKEAKVLVMESVLSSAKKQKLVMC